jgi:hypothetical protein
MNGINNIVGKTWQRGWAVFNELLVHTIIIVFVVIFIKVIELVVGYSHPHGEMHFFKDSKFQFPAQWLFDAADVAMMVCLLFRGVVSAYLVYKGEEQ